MRSAIALKFVPFILCFVILFPYAVYANDGEKQSAEDWLTDDERTYVAQMRSAFSECRKTITEMKKVLENPRIAGPSAALATQIIAFAGLLNGASQPFCELKVPESMEGYIAEQEKLCALALSSAAYASKAGNDWVQSSAFWSATGGLLPYIDTLITTYHEITRLESAIDAAESKLNDLISDVAEVREEADEFFEELLGDIDCFIATAAYGTGEAEEIQTLREFRDEFLLKNPGGELLVLVYYRVSPPIAQVIAYNMRLKSVVRRGFIDPVVGLLELSRPLWGR